MRWIKLTKREFKILFFGAVIIVLVLALVPNDNLKFNYAYEDKIKHTLAFFTLSLLLNRASSTLKHRVRNMISLLFFGIFIEVAQSFTGYRSPSFDDVLADLVGILLFQLLYSTYRFIKHFRNKTP